MDNQGETELSPDDELFMITRVNLPEVGLRWSKRIKELETAKSHRLHKARVTYSTCIKQVIGLFTLLCTTSKHAMPKHCLPENPTLLQCFVNRMDKANDHCNGTLNQISYFSFLTNMALNETFTYHQARQQDDWSSFVTAMEKKIEDQESCNYWTLVPRSSLPEKAKTIKAI
eukprot:13706721-Ditylum_brightwellii.AAC.2